jgi:GDP-L-fucose synthase
MNRLSGAGYANIVVRTSTELDLRDQREVEIFFRKEKPEYVFMAAAKVGGIKANNTYRAVFAYDNLMIQNNIIHYSFLNDVKKLLFLGSSCIYPKMAPQPLKEEYLLSGKLEDSNEPYAIAKIAGIKLCDAYRAQYGCNFISAMPTNLYGANDNYDLHDAHVLPALLRKFHEARVRDEKEVIVWGTGQPRREFLYADDCADACLFLMRNYNEQGIINIGIGEDISIKELATLIKTVVGFDGGIKFDSTQPDGTPRKVLDISRIRSLGWRATVPLYEGLQKAYESFVSHSLNLNKSLLLPVY